MKELLESYPQTKYKLDEEERQKKLIRSKSPVFDGAKGELFYIEERGEWLPSPKVIQRRESTKNLFKDIRETAIQYFELNDIEWWGQSENLYFPTGHVLSSQIHCLNHLFAIRADHDAVLKIIQSIFNDIKDVLPSPIDEKFCYMERFPYETPSFISFEFIYNNREYLHERCNKRGANCTSVDAFIYAIDKDDNYILIPIEWKYTEAYNQDDDKRVKDDVIQKRYLDLVNQEDSNLSRWNENYYWDPQYELARQTLLIEQIIRNKPFPACDYRHIVVCPRDNTEMMQDAKSFRESLKNKSKFRIIDPQELLSPIAEDKNYEDLITYLQIRYWKK